MFGSALQLVNRLPPLRLTVARFLTSLVAPPRCLFCGAPGQPWDEIWGLDLCEHCEAACPRFHPQVEPAPEGGELRALFRYAPPADELITRLKFRLELAPARVLGMLFAQHCAPDSLPDCLIPLPLHAGRLRERGFNQSIEIARHLAPRLGLRVHTGLLQRVRATQAQSALTAAQRASNVADAFRVNARAAALPTHVALLDDVMTTGSTFAAAAQALRRAGVDRVDGWFIARAERE